MIYIKTDDAERMLHKLHVVLSDQQIRIVQARSINKTLMQGRTMARTEIKKVYNISQKNLAGVDFKRAYPATVTGQLVASRKPIPLDAFAPKQETAAGSRRITKKGALKVVGYKRPKKNVSGGVSIQIFKNTRVVIPFAFMIPGGAIRVFARGQYKNGASYGFVQRFHRVKSQYGSDSPIKPMITLSDFAAILNPKVLGNIGKELKIIYPKIFVNQVAFLLSQIK